MRIICPTCASHYEVEADKIGMKGQLVRCADCRDVWRVMPDASPAEATPPPPRALGAPIVSVPADHGRALTSNPPIDFAAAKARLQARRDRLDTGQNLGRTLAGTAVTAVCVAALMGTIGFRAAIVRQLPQTAAAFRTIGLPVNPKGLALRDVHSVLVAEGDKTVLTLEGSIANLRDETTALPDLAVVVRDAAQSPLYSWTAPPPKARLAKGETIAFHSRLAAPPVSGQDIRVSFAEARSAAGPGR